MRRLLLVIPFVFALVGLLLIATVRGSSILPAEGISGPMPYAAIIAGTSACATTDDVMCLRVMTGTLRAVYHISNPNGITGFEEYHLVNFDQRLLAASPTSIDVEVVSEAFVDTRSGYPVSAGELPAEVRDTYLQPTDMIQSDNPEISAKAKELVQGATWQAGAVESILAWVVGNVTYDWTFSLPNDAISVYHNRSGICCGFSNLAIALLRAAGVPSRMQTGCFMPLAEAEPGEGHAWVEVYYPDVGWVASEPQHSANYIGPVAIADGFDQCADVATAITEISWANDLKDVVSMRTPYDTLLEPWVSAAHVPSWMRNVLNIYPEAPAVMLTTSAPTGELGLGILDLHCRPMTLTVTTESSWLPAYVRVNGEAVSLQVDATGLPLGTYQSAIHFYQAPWDPFSRTVTATLFLVESIERVFLPAVWSR